MLERALTWVISTRRAASADDASRTVADPGTMIRRGRCVPGALRAERSVGSGGRHGAKQGRSRPARRTGIGRPEQGRPSWRPGDRARGRRAAPGLRRGRSPGRGLNSAASERFPIGGGGGWTLASRGPQQQDAWRHFVPQAAVQGMLGPRRISGGTTPPRPLRHDLDPAHRSARPRARSSGEAWGAGLGDAPLPRVKLSKVRDEDSRRVFQVSEPTEGMIALL